VKQFFGMSQSKRSSPRLTHTITHTCGMHVTPQQPIMKCTSNIWDEKTDKATIKVQLIYHLF